MKTLRELAEEAHSCIEAQFMEVQLWDEYCKAANPSAILALLAQIDALTAERNALAKKLRSFEKSPEDERKAFEEIVRKHMDPEKANEYLFTDEYGKYGEWGLMLAWEAWKAAKADRGQS